MMSLIPVPSKAPGPLQSVIGMAKKAGDLAGIFKAKKLPAATADVPFNGAGIASGTEWGIRNSDYTVSIVRTGSKIGQPGHVIAHIPETIDLNVIAEYSQPYAELALGSPILQGLGKAFGLKISSNAFSMQVWEGSSPIELTIPFKFVAVRDSYEEVVRPIRELSRFCLPEVVTPNTGGGFVQFGIIKSPGPNLLFNGSSLIDNAEAGVSGAGKVIKKTAGNVADDVMSGDFTEGAVDAVVGTATAAATFVNNLLRSISVENNISLHIGRFCRLRSVVVKNVSQTYNTRFDSEGQMIEATVNVTVATFVNPTSADIPEIVGWKSVPSVSGPAVDANGMSTDGPLLTPKYNVVTGVKEETLSDIADSLGVNAALKPPVPPVPFSVVPTP